jgi:hypothetical protein
VLTSVSGTISLDALERRLLPDLLPPSWGTCVTVQLGIAPAGPVADYRTLSHVRVVCVSQACS